ncbi:MAG: hypothetical protein LBR80_09375 [Deltaproteobacteria bacterium]|jgi:hypothetical protein|nr:hypothetical protein [Deltaproteobacteria bacterium]
MGSSVVRTIGKSLTCRSTEAFCLPVPFALQQRVMNGGPEIDRDNALRNAREDIFVECKWLLYHLELKIKGNRTVKNAPCGCKDLWREA